jgi:hypothetical protein
MIDGRPSSSAAALGEDVRRFALAFTAVFGQAQPRVFDFAARGRSDYRGLSDLLASRFISSPAKASVSAANVSAPLASGISVWGVAAAIASSGAIRARPQAPVLVSSRRRARRMKQSAVIGEPATQRPCFSQFWRRTEKARPPARSHPGSSRPDRMRLAIGPARPIRRRPARAARVR